MFIGLIYRQSIKVYSIRLKRMKAYEGLVRMGNMCTPVHIFELISSSNGSNLLIYGN